MNYWVFTVFRGSFTLFTVCSHLCTQAHLFHGTCSKHCLVSPLLFGCGFSNLVAVAIPWQLAISQQKVLNLTKAESLFQPLVVEFVTTTYTLCVLQPNMQASCESKGTVISEADVQTL